MVTLILIAIAIAIGIRKPMFELFSSAYGVLGGCAQVLNACRFADTLKPHSIVLRASAQEQELNALIWVPKRVGAKRRKDLSYLKVRFCIEHQRVVISA